MRRRLLIALALILLAAPRARSDEDEKTAPPPGPFAPEGPKPIDPDPNSPTGRANVVLGSTDAEYAELRSRLVGENPADVLAVLDAVRAELKAFGRPLSSLPEAAWFSDELLDPSSKDEGVLLERGLSEKEPWVVRAEAHFMRIRTRQVAEVLKEHEPDPKGSIRAVPQEVAAILLGRRGVDQVARPEAPTAEALSGQTVTFLSVSRARYLQDYDWQSGMTKAMPVVAAVEGGVRLLVTATRVRDNEDLVALDVVMQTGTPKSPVAIFSTSLAGGLDPVTIQLPEVRVTGVSEKLEVPIGSWVLACGQRAPYEAEIAATLFRVSRGVAPSREAHPVERK